jgi:hypothetical protein
MKNLQTYIDQKNAWGNIFNKPGIAFPLSQNTVDGLARSLDGDLSPENLHCDGEISQRQAQAKYNFYGRVIRELDRYCVNNNLTVPTVHEYY